MCSHKSIFAWLCTTIPQTILYNSTTQTTLANVISTHGNLISSFRFWYWCTLCCNCKFFISDNLIWGPNSRLEVIKTKIMAFFFSNYDVSNWGFMFSSYYVIKWYTLSYKEYMSNFIKEITTASQVSWLHILRITQRNTLSQSPWDNIMPLLRIFITTFSINSDPIHREYVITFGSYS